MNTRTPFNSPASHFAQPAIESKALLINGQNLIDAFADCDMEQCQKMAGMLASGSYEQFGRVMAKVLKDWSEST